MLPTRRTSSGHYVSQTIVTYSGLSRRILDQYVFWTPKTYFWTIMTYSWPSWHILDHQNILHHKDIFWTIRTCSGLSWRIMGSQDIFWTRKTYSALSRHILDYQDIFWTTKTCYGPSRRIADYQDIYPGPSQRKEPSDQAIVLKQPTADHQLQRQSFRGCTLLFNKAQLQLSIMFV